MVTLKLEIILFIVLVFIIGCSNNQLNSNPSDNEPEKIVKKYFEAWWRKRTG